MRVMILGGPRSGEQLDLPDGAGAWVDLREALTYPARAITWVTTDHATGAVLQRFKLPVVVWPGFMTMGPQQEQAQVNNALIQLAMTTYMQIHGELQEQKSEASDSEQ